MATNNNAMVNVSKAKHWKLLMWSLRSMLAAGQFSVLASMVLSFCLLKRRDEEERNGVAQVLKHYPLRKNDDIWHRFGGISDLLSKLTPEEQDRVIIVLDGHDWFNTRSSSIDRRMPDLRNALPVLHAFDGMVFYRAAGDDGDGQYLGEYRECFLLCGNDGCFVTSKYSMGLGTNRVGEFHEATQRYRFALPDETVLRNFKEYSGLTLWDALETNIEYDIWLRPVETAKAFTA